jgi:hypothetical protein
MLAYLFWHWRQPAVDAGDYEARQRAFHAALQAAPPPGYLGSITHGLAGAPWAAAGGEAYEDWYRVEDSAALDALNTAAITASRQGPHDAAAAVVAGGTAGIYSLRLGSPVDQPTFATWFAKPDGMRYDELMDRLRPVVESGAALWMRYMVLGPSPEFCLHSTRRLELPGELHARVLPLRPVWPSAAQPSS